MDKDGYHGYDKNAEINTPAFPWTHSNITCVGMTLRDYFAAKAIIAYHADGKFSSCEDVANWCYRLADAMLKARNAD
jgi:hypothetical protein